MELQCATGEDGTAARGRRNPPDRSRAVRGFPAAFTLLEMLIVLAVVVAVASIGWPTVRKLWEKSSLKDAARQLRAAMAQARLDAIESTEVRFLRYRPGTGQFEVSRGVSPGGTAQLAADAATATFGELAADAAPGTAGQTTPHELPHEVVFADPEAPAEASLGDVALGSSAGWSDPLYFFPNGRTSRARIYLASPRYRIEVRLRGFTGTVQLGVVERITNDLQPRVSSPSEGLP